MAVIAPEADRAPRVAVADDHVGEAVGLATWVMVVGVAVVWGTVSVRTTDVGLHAAPFKGHWAWHGSWQLLPAAGLGAAVAVWGPRVARKLAWQRVPFVTGAVAAVWTAALAAGDGWSRLTAPLATRHEYEPFAAGVGDVGRFLSTYVERLGDQPIHVQGHPPGPVVLAWALDQVSLSGAGWLAAIAIGAWGVAVAAALCVARRLAGEEVARRLAPALAVLPAAVWAGTSVDPVFAALTAVAIAVAAGRRPFVGGGVFGVALLFSYGAVPLGLALAAVVVVAAPSWSRAVSALAQAASAVAVVLGLAAAAGFWWLDGLAATRAAYWDGIGSERPGRYLTLVGNPAALAVALGPAVAVGLGAFAGRRLRPRLALPHGVRSLLAQPVHARLRANGLVVVIGAALVAVTVADLSQLARGETERIWLPFVPWLALAAPGDRRGWLAAQVGLALVLQSFLASPW
jgi:hypothetical protein